MGVSVPAHTEQCVGVRLVNHRAREDTCSLIGPLTKEDTRREADQAIVGATGSPYLCPD